MSIIEAVYSALKQEGYLPRIGEGGQLHFRYYGQNCALRSHAVGEQTIAELECSLPRPAPSLQIAQQFGERHPLARLGEHHGRAALFLTTLIGQQDTGRQAALLLQLLDQYTADLMFGEDAATLLSSGQPSVNTEAVSSSPAPAQSAPVPPTVPVAPSEESAAASPQPVAESPVSSAPETRNPVGVSVPAGWEDFWALMNERYHPLALALARLGVPVPSDVQVDMLQGRQVKGTAIMLWEATPQSVVICEPGQMVPEGYLGGTWLRHFTVDQVAASIQHNLRRVGRL